nr:type II toxin-antitoxin system RelE/ParE family toxin [Bartonella sp. 11B]
MVDFLDQHVTSLEDVRAIGKPLRGQLSGLWRYRVGDYRILCDLYDKELVVLVLAVGHRKNIYKG